MKKICFILFCTVLLYSSLYTQETISKITQSYFRYDPFSSEFSQFLNKLINDPALSNKKINKKNDSTLFHLQGHYASHSPFFFPTIACKIILAERQEYADTSSNNVFTYFNYQLIGYAKDGEEGRKDIEQEFEKLSRRFKKGFKASNQNELKTGNEKTGDIVNFLITDLPFYPLSIAWSSSTDKKNNMLVISVGFYMTDNYAYLPKSANSP
jgi:hypothetical protein